MTEKKRYSNAWDVTRSMIEGTPGPGEEVAKAETVTSDDGSKLNAAIMATMITSAQAATATRSGMLSGWYCPSCNGSGIVNGHTSCPTCNGSGVLANRGPALSMCSPCGGSGRMAGGQNMTKCPHCHGMGITTFVPASQVVGGAGGAGGGGGFGASSGVGGGLPAGAGGGGGAVRIVTDDPFELDPSVRKITRWRG